MQLADVAYGASGAFTINPWLRNPSSDYQREGSSAKAAAAHDELAEPGSRAARKLGVRTIVTDSTDVEHEDGASTDTDPATGADLDEGAWHVHTDNAPRRQEGLHRLH